MKTTIFEKKYQINNEFGITVEKRTLKKDFKTHTHDFFEIELITSGEALHTVNGYTYKITAGDIYLLQPSDFHSIKTEKPLEYYNIRFTEQAVSAYMLYELTQQESTTFFKLSFKDRNAIESILKLGLNMPNDEWSGNYIKNLCECVMITILRKRKITPHTPHSHKSIYKTILYINRNFRSDISLDRLADEALLSKNYFCSQFKKIFGINVIDYINTVRISYAENMLKSTDIPITNICFNSGFGSYPVFYRMFKKHTGYTPSQFRKTKTI